MLTQLRISSYFSLFVVCLITIANSTKALPNSLSEEEIYSLKQIANQMPLRDAIGQLLVIGAPVDATSYRSVNNLGKFAQEFKVGNLFFTSYHYPFRNDSSPNANLEEIQVFHRFIRNNYRSWKMPPPLFFVDFESNTINSFNRYQPIIPPAPPLTLTTTGDADLIRTCGTYAGYQLRAIGVDAILGPVLDIDGTSQGTRNDLIGNRSFGGSAQIVYGAASNYLFGLNDAGILCFLKHYPGHGFVRGCEFNSQEYPTFYGCSGNLLTNLEPFRKLGQYASGIVSAHITLAQFNNQIATFLPNIVNNLLRTGQLITPPSNHSSKEPLLGLNFPNILLITDDLSNTGSIIKYIRDKKAKSYADVAVQALNAGHDLLLFSHIETNSTKRGYFGAFGFKELKNVIEKIEENAKNSEIFNNNLRKSLLRVLITKMKLLKSWKPDRQEGIYSWTLPKREDGDIEKPPFLTRANYRDASHLLSTVMQKAFVRVVPYSGSTINPLNNSVMFVPDTIERFFSKGVENMSIETISSNWPDVKNDKDREWKKLVDKITEAVSDNNIRRVIYIYTGTGDDNNLIEHMTMITSENPEKRQKIVILMHASPKWLPQASLSGFEIVGNFTTHPLSYDVDKAFLNGYCSPREMANLPIPIGLEKEVFIPTIVIPPAEGLYPLIFPTSEEAAVLQETIKNLYNQLDNSGRESSEQIDILQKELKSLKQESLKQINMINTLQKELKSSKEESLKELKSSKQESLKQINILQKTIDNSKEIYTGIIAFGLFFVTSFVGLMLIIRIIKEMPSNFHTYNNNIDKVLFMPFRESPIKTVLLIVFFVLTCFELYITVIIGIKLGLAFPSIITDAIKVKSNGNS